MKLFRVFWVLYVLIIAFVPFVLTYPLLLYFTSSPKRYQLAHGYRNVWGRFICFMAGFKRETTFETDLDTKQTYIICANHSSYLDIISTTCGLPIFFIFMAKYELAKIPLFGRFFKTIDIAVERQSVRKSYESFELAKERLTKGSSVLIFPEGGIKPSTPKLAPFKNGAFRLAIENQTPILPISILDNYKRLPNGDFWNASPGKMRMIVHRPVEVTNLKPEDEKDLKQKVYSIIETSLKKHIPNLDS